MKIIKRTKLSPEELAKRRAEKKAERLAKMELKDRKRKLKAQNQKIEAKPLTEEQIVKFATYYKKHKKFPSSKIPCNLTGKLTTCVGDWMHKKVEEYGSAENLLRKYVSRKALKEQKDATKKVTKKSRDRKVLNEMKVGEKIWDLPKVDMHSVPRPLTASEVTESTQGCCFRPDIYLNNDEHCEGCEFFEPCSCRLKRLPKKRGK